MRWYSPFNYEYLLACEDQAPAGIVYYMYAEDLALKRSGDHCKLWSQTGDNAEDRIATRLN